jgi:hypothetical protein
MLLLPLKWPSVMRTLLLPSHAVGVTIAAAATDLVLVPLAQSDG